MVHQAVMEPEAVTLFVRGPAARPPPTQPKASCRPRTLGRPRPPRAKRPSRPAPRPPRSRSSGRGRTPTGRRPSAPCR
jgi:hypothetical protein